MAPEEVHRNIRKLERRVTTLFEKFEERVLEEQVEKEDPNKYKF